MYEELIDALRRLSDWSSMDFEDNLSYANQIAKEPADAIAELSRRETPMRLRITTSTKRCPSCNKQVSGIGNIHGNYRYCRWCGQAIDWSEPPKEDA